MIRCQTQVSAVINCPNNGGRGQDHQDVPECTQRRTGCVLTSRRQRAFHPLLSLLLFSSAVFPKRHAIRDNGRGFAEGERRWRGSEARLRRSCLPSSLSCFFSFSASQQQRSNQSEASGASLCALIGRFLQVFTCTRHAQGARLRVGVQPQTKVIKKPPRARRPRSHSCFVSSETRLRRFTRGPKPASTTRKRRYIFVFVSLCCGSRFSDLLRDTQSLRPIKTATTRIIKERAGGEQIFFSPASVYFFYRPP